MSHHFFSKKEHLVSLQDINALFSQKSGAINGYPVRLIYRVAGNNTLPALVLISVSKRHFKHAVDRNRVKRQLREAYRLQKQVLHEAMRAHEGQELLLAFIGLSDQHEETARIMRRTGTLLQRISERL